MKKTNYSNYSRYAAIKTTIKELLEGSYIEGNEQETNHILIGKQKNFRCNLIATVLAKETLGSITNLTLDDRTIIFPVPSGLSSLLASGTESCQVRRRSPYQVSPYTVSRLFRQSHSQRRAST